MKKNKKRKSKNFIKTIVGLGVIASPITSSFIIVEYALKNGTPTPKPEPITGYVADSFTYNGGHGIISANTVEASFIIKNLHNNGEPYALTNYNFGIYMSYVFDDRIYAGIITAGVGNVGADINYETEPPKIISSGTERTVTWVPGSATQARYGYCIACRIQGKEKVQDMATSLETTFKLCIFQENPTENKTGEDTYIFVKDKNGDELSFVESIDYPCN